MANASTLLIPTQHPLALVRFVCRRPFCPHIHSYLAKEYPYIIAPYFHHTPASTQPANTTATNARRFKLRQMVKTRSKFSLTDFFDPVKPIKPRKKTPVKPLNLTTYFGTVKLSHNQSFTDTPAYSIINVQL